MRSSHTAIAALLIAGLATAPLAARSTPTGPSGCSGVLATIDTTWIAEAGADTGKNQGFEVGKLTGTLNGVVYLAYDDEAPPVSPKTTKPNLVILTDQGELDLWVYSESKPDADGSWQRKFSVLASDGTGNYAGATTDLTITGAYYPENKGIYQAVGMVCTSTKPKPRG